MILASMSVETKTPVSDIPLVREFPEVFEEVSGLPPEREEHKEHLRVVLKTLKDNKIYAKLSKCDF